MPEMQILPKEELNRRIASLQTQLAEKGTDGALIMHSTDLVYFTGVFQNSFLYIPVEGEPLFMVRRSMERATALTPLSKVIPVKSIKQVPGIIKENGYEQMETLGVEMDVLPASMFFNLQKLFPGVNLVDCSAIIKKQRAVKSSLEIEQIQHVSDMMDKVFASVPEFLRPGMTEVELAGQLEARLRKEGHQGLVRVRGFNQDFHYGCLLSGPNGGVPSFFDGPLGGPGIYAAFPFGTGDRVIEKNEPVLIDYVGVKNGYSVDMTRLYVIGDLDDKLSAAHKTALDIQQAVVDAARPGALGSDIYEKAYGIACDSGLEEWFMGCIDQVSFIAHGVGLELNELPVLARGLKMQLEEGMVIALEPKFVFPGEGAVGIENTFVVTAEGLKRFSSYPDEVVNIK